MATSKITGQIITPVSKPENSLIGSYDVKYLRFGSIVVVTGVIQTTGSLEHGTVIAENLPAPSSNMCAIRAINSSITSGMEDAYINASTLRNQGSWQAGYHRFSSAYISAS